MSENKLEMKDRQVDWLLSDMFELNWHVWMELWCESLLQILQGYTPDQSYVYSGQRAKVHSKIQKPIPFSLTISLTSLS